MCLRYGRFNKGIDKVTSRKIVEIKDLVDMDHRITVLEISHRDDCGVRTIHYIFIIHLTPEECAENEKVLGN